MQIGLLNITLKERLINDDIFHYINKIDRIPASSNGTYLLPNYGCIMVSGADTLSFLQGQLAINCEIKPLPSFGAYCNIKGRVVTLFYTHQENDHTYLIMPSALIKKTLQLLNFYGKFSKVTIEHCMSLTPICIINKDAYQWQLLNFDDESTVAAFQQQIEQRVLYSSYEFHLQQLVKRIPTIYQSTQLQWLPHKIGLHKIGAIDVEKGCYLGQEIIARMHFKGKLKSRVHLFVSHEAQKAGESIKVNEEVIGETIDSTILPDGKHLILAAILKTAMDKVQEINQP